MELKITNQAKRYRLITAGLLLAGFGLAAAIYVNATAPAGDPFSEFEHSKRYTHSLELNGGKFVVIANEFKDWFAGLWSGEELAFTVAWITVVIAIAYFFIASGLEHDTRSDKDQDGAG
jgi:hypothetical protein